MADVSQNISAQLFVKELPAAQRADYTGCKQNFNSAEFTTCVNDTESDNAVENAFQKQLNLSEYYKSPEVFNTIKNNYMEKTMDSHFETEEVYMGPTPAPPGTASATQNIKTLNTLPIKIDTKESFGAMDNSSMWVMIFAVIAIMYFCKK
jgi:hypothetical protein